VSRLVILALIVLVPSTAHAGQAFPGEPRELKSPDGALTVFWWEPDAASPKRSLLLRAAVSPKSWRIYEFGRSVLVEWSPRGHLLAITDRETSDGSTTSVYNPDTREFADVCAPAVRDLGARWTEANRRYCELTGWPSPGRLRLHLWGSGRGGDFDLKTTVPVSATAAPP